MKAGAESACDSEGADERKKKTQGHEPLGFFTKQVECDYFFLLAK